MKPRVLFFSSALLPCLILLMLFIRCNDIGEEDAVPVGAYNVVAYDGKSLRIVHHGWLSIVFKDSENILGQWQFDGLQTERLVGHYRDGVLALSLNPDYVDNNLFFRGTIVGRKYAGEWEQTGFPGVMKQGSFVGMRR